MKTPSIVLAGALCGALLAHPPIARAQTPQPPVQLTWVDRTGKAIETVGPSAAYRGPDLAPDGKRLAVHRHEDVTAPGSTGSGDVFVFESGPGPGRRLTPASSGAVDNAMPIWSPSAIMTTTLRDDEVRSSVSTITARRLRCLLQRGRTS